MASALASRPGFVRIRALPYYWMIGAALAVLAPVLGWLGYDHAFVAILTVSSLCLIGSSNFYNPFQTVWIGSHVAFCVTPCLLILLTGLPMPVEVATLCLLGSFFVVAMTSGFGRQPDRRSVGEFLMSPFLRPGLFTVIAACLASLIIAHFSSKTYFYMAFPVAAIAYTLYISDKKPTTSLMAFVPLLATMLIFANVYWDGFGRLLLAGNLLVPALFLVYKYEFSHIKFILPILAGAGSLLGTFLRFTEASFTNLARLALADSSVAPMLTGQSIYDAASRFGGRGLSGLIDQYVLFFLGLFPRALWPDKPQGFGFQYVLDNMSQGYVLSGHSVAASYFGDHIYYGGIVGGILSTVIALTMFCGMYVIAANKKFLNGMFSLVFCTFIPTFYWAGMSSFGQRFMIGVVFVIIYLSILGAALVLSPPRRARGRVHPRSHATQQN